ncbi:LA_2272 family surface repeat-containing protein [Pedobacter frigiditerrae]|uniref:LA_2272 family surface repeat-containing protein n=1 Tax=Pedobacter frigiditerrae TaxID=2530452 RepID=UPI00292D1F23|nr:hypothetical protein [Pedobacter frigiditerrae]
MMRIVTIIYFVCFLFNTRANAQSILGRKVSLNIVQQKLSVVLTMLEEKGEFRFSFNSDILPVDSVVTVKENNISIAETLEKLLTDRFEYRQSGNFVIIRYAPLELKLLILEALGTPELYTVKGQIVDKRTEQPISDASVYEKFLLVSEISDVDGFFVMRLKKITQPISLTISKENYKSTTTHFLAEVNITNKQENSSETFVNGNLEEIAKTWIGNALVTAKQKVQSVNIGGFISKAPFQFGLTPGLNSHGSLSGQVVNKFSFNAVGAYSAGVDGAEIGLVFNIDKSDVRFFQFGGAFNLVGGNVQGAQIAGFFNYVIGDVKAAQITLGYNHVGKNFEGFQVGGVYNRINENLKGMQVSLGLNAIGNNLNGFQVGALNLIAKDTRGVQIGVGGNVVNGRSTGMQVAGIANINKESNGLNMAAFANLTALTARGAQVGVLNYAKTLKGLQVGILNISGENDGYSIGLVNIALKGYHKLGLSTNETTELNAIYKGGSKRFYNMLMFGTNTKSSTKIYTGGLGFGKEISLFKSLSLNPEISSQYVYQGDWEYVNLLSKFELPVNIKINKWFAIQGGPSLNVYYTKQQTAIGDYGLLQQKHKDFSFKNSNYTGWIGWNVGIVLL